jgi:transposase-like protein
VRPSERRRRFTLEYKRRIVEEARQCRETNQVGALLRREGLYSSHLAAFRSQLAKPPVPRGRKPQDPALLKQAEENRQLRKEVGRLKAKLAQAEIVIDVQKKVSQLLGIRLSEPTSEEND